MPVRHIAEAIEMQDIAFIQKAAAKKVELAKFCVWNLEDILKNETLPRELQREVRAQLETARQTQEVASQRLQTLLAS